MMAEGSYFGNILCPVDLTLRTVEAALEEAKGTQVAGTARGSMEGRILAASRPHLGRI